MMMRLFWNLLVLVAASSAFAPMRPAVGVTTTARHMHESTDGPKQPVPAKPLEEVAPSLEEVDSSSAEPMQQSSSSGEKNYVKDMNTGEIREVGWVRLEGRAVWTGDIL